MVPEDSYPLSPMQQGMLFHSLYSEHSGVDVEQLVCALHEELNAAAFERAWQRVVERHPVLRTSFRWEGYSEPRQEVQRGVPLRLQQQDWRGLPVPEQEQRLAGYLQAERQQGFDLTRAPLMRVALFRWAEADYRFVWTFHHILLDGRSLALVLKELFAFYAAFCEGQELSLPLPRPYRDFIDWLHRQELPTAETFWRGLLKGFTAPTPLVVTRAPGQATGPGEGNREQAIRLPAAVTSALRSLAQEHALTLNTFVQGAWALLLSRYSGEEVVFGATRACRRSALEGAESMVGLFINTLPVRTRVPPDMALLPWLRELRAQHLAVRAYEHTPLVKVQGWSEVPRGTPLFETIVVFENYRLDSALRAQGGSWTNREFRLVEQTNYPLTVAACSGPELLLKIQYGGSRFDDKTITRMLGHLETLLTRMAADPEQPLSTLPLLTEAERRQLLVEWNGTRTEYPQDRCIHQLFEEQVQRTPEAVAAEFEGEQLTYRELNQRANQLAHHLRKLGVGAEMLVALCVERSLEMLVGLLGILKAGGAYLPLDPSYPEERLAFMLQDGRASILLTQQRLAAVLPKTEAHVICLDSDWMSIASGCQENPVSGVTADNLAYVIYTSGSTGRPKGVMILHRAVCNYLFWRQAYFPLNETDRLLQKTSLCFDDSVWECFEPLMAGARLILARPGGQQDAAYLVREIARHQITAASFVPSLLQALMEEPGIEACDGLRRVTTGGEVLPVELQERFFACLPARLYNGYGPTEATIAATFWACRHEPDQRTVPIGRPIANAQIYLLDRNLQPVPVGVPGELYIGGDGLARSYFNQPELTAERFLSHPFSHRPGARLYRTGDLARYRPDGNLEFLGRLDDQVKLRGVRIELGEIEAVLREHPQVRECAVRVEEAGPGRKHLVAYVVPDADLSPKAGDLRAFLRDHLPEPMVPALVVLLKALPLGPSGKVDRRALPEPAWRELKEAFVAPRTPIEQALAAVWSSVLGLERVGVHDNFFELGGHSLLATQVMSRVRSTFRVVLPLRHLFETPTVTGMALVITHRLAEQAEQEEIARLLAALERLPENEAAVRLPDSGP